MARRALVAMVLVALAVAGAASAGLLTRGSAKTASPAAPDCATSTAPPAPLTTTATTTFYTPPVACTSTPTPTTTPSTPTATPSTPTATPPKPTVTTSSSSSTLVITGHGWGHGMGMSQWGANGYAEHGWSATQILLHYYQGTTIGNDPAPLVRVLLTDGARTMLASASPWYLVDGHGTKLALPAGKLLVPSTLEISGRQLVSPLTFTPGAAPLEVGKAAYRGRLLVVSNGRSLQVVNEVGMEQYLDGVVGAEMPQSWPQAALQAQAIAARTYALAELENVVTASPFDLYADTRSQVYGGIDAESAPVTAAVTATSGRVVLYQGKIATTYFSSSSGGRTVSAAEALGTPIPYLVSVPDPYDTLSPYHDWGPVLVDARSAGTALGVSGPLLDLETVAGASDHVATATAFGPARQVTLTGAEIRDDLGLRSSWFQVAWLTLTPPPAPVPFGGSVSLAGAARGLTGVSLEEKTPSAAWRTVGTVSPDGSGAFAIEVSPSATTRYRLAAGSVRGALIELKVAPRVSATEAADGVQGTVSPGLAGAPVLLQQQDGTRWTTVASGVTGAGGAFAIQAALSAGAYRVRCAPGHGLAPGDSTPLTAAS